MRVECLIQAPTISTESSWRERALRVEQLGRHVLEHHREVRAGGDARLTGGLYVAFSVSVAGRDSTPVTPVAPNDTSAKSVAFRSPGRAPNGAASKTGNR